MAGLVLKGVEKVFGAVPVLHGIDLEFTVFVRPSGGSKSTTLRVIAEMADTTNGTLANGMRPEPQSLAPPGSGPVGRRFH